MNTALAFFTPPSALPVVADGASKVVTLISKKILSTGCYGDYVLLMHGIEEPRPLTLAALVFAST